MGSRDAIPLGYVVELPYTLPMIANIWKPRAWYCQPDFIVNRITDHSVFLSVLLLTFAVVEVKYKLT